MCRSRLTRDRSIWEVTRQSVPVTALLDIHTFDVSPDWKWSKRATVAKKLGAESKLEDRSINLNFLPSTDFNRISFDLCVQHYTNTANIGMLSEYWNWAGEIVLYRINNRVDWYKKLANGSSESERYFGGNLIIRLCSIIAIYNYYYVIGGNAKNQWIGIRLWYSGEMVKWKILNCLVFEESVRMMSQKSFLW